MKFTEHLGTHLTPEWRVQYIQYEVRRNRKIYIFDDISGSRRVMIFITGGAVLVSN